jgi:hypothetical protein
MDLPAMMHYGSSGNDTEKKAYQNRTCAVTVKNGQKKSEI